MERETKVNPNQVIFNVTRQRYIPEDFKLHTRRHENLKSHSCSFVNFKISNNFECISKVGTALGLSPLQTWTLSLLQKYSNKTQNSQLYENPSLSVLLID
jgi:hypothetical protein